MDQSIKLEATRNPELAEEPSKVSAITGSQLNPSMGSLASSKVLRVVMQAEADANSLTKQGSPLACRFSIEVLGAVTLPTR